MTQKRASTATAGLVVYLALSFLGSWFVAATLHVFALNVAPVKMGTRLFTTSLLYAVTMGWQPLAASWLVRRWIDPVDGIDLGLRPSKHAFTIVGVAATFALAGAAMALAWLGAAAGLTETASLTGEAEAAALERGSSVIGIVSPSAALVGTLILVWMQTFSEEVGWRGYFLLRAMERFGSWRGLMLQGVAWGVWYAPVLFFSTYGPNVARISAMRGLGFAIACVPIGALFGWLRLASKSLVPVITTNTTLTLIAGLPYVLHGVDAGLRSSIFGPPGWVILAIGVGGLAGSRWRAVVKTPERVHLSIDFRGSAVLRMGVTTNGRSSEEHGVH